MSMWDRLVRVEHLFDLLGPDGLRRASLPHELLVPRRGLRPGRAGRAGGRAGPGRACRHRPPGPLRRRPVRRPPRRRPGIRPVIGIEVELLDRDRPGPGAASSSRPAPASTASRGGRGPVRRAEAVEGVPDRPRPERARLPGHRDAGQGGPPRDRRAAARRRISCCSPATRSATGACAGSSRGRTSPGRRRVPRFIARRCSPSTPKGSWRCRAAARARSRGGCGSATGTGARAAAADAADAHAVSGRCRVHRRAVAPPAARRRLARRRARRARRRAATCRSSSRTTSTTPGRRVASSRTS